MTKKAKESVKGKEKVAVAERPPRSRLRELYEKTVRPALVKEFAYDSVMQAPRLEKIVVNMGVGEVTQDSKQLGSAIRDLTIITGQKPVSTTARKSISNFKLRAGTKFGCKVTLRGERMYHFLDKLITVVLPRLRDFRGLNPRSFEGRENFSIGLKEQIVFPEIDYDTFDRIRGMDIIMCTSARTDDEALAFLKRIGLPFRQR